MCKTATEWDLMSVAERVCSSEQCEVFEYFSTIVFFQSGKLDLSVCGGTHQHKLSRLMARLFLPNWFLINSDQSLIGF